MLFSSPSSFGSTPQWYQTFFKSEQEQSHPSKAFSSILEPLVPAQNYELLVRVLEILGRMAAHAEANGCGGSKGSMIVGWWVLGGEGTRGEHEGGQGQGWETWYKGWEKRGREMEHLFLARIRWVISFLFIFLSIRLVDLPVRFFFTFHASTGVVYMRIVVTFICLLVLPLSKSHECSFHL